MTPDKYLESLRTLSKTQLVVLTVVLVASVYLIQRSVEIINVELRPFGTRSGDTAYQFTIFGLAFSRVFLSVIWPLLIGFGCMLFTELVIRRQRLLTTLKTAVEPRILQQILDSDVLSLSQRSLNISGQRQLWRIVSWLPVAALLFHSTSQLAFLSTHSRSFAYGYPNLLTPLVMFVVLAAAQVSCILLAAIWCRKFPAAIRSASQGSLVTSLSEETASDIRE